MAVFVLKILAICAIKMIDLPSYLYNPFGVQADYLLYKPTYTVLPVRFFYLLCFLADLGTAWHLRSYNYLLYSAFCPLDISALENWALVCLGSSSLFISQIPTAPRCYAKKRGTSNQLAVMASYIWYLGVAEIKAFLPGLNYVLRFRFLFDLESYEHLPSLSGFFYFRMCMLKQFQYFSNSVIALMGCSFVAQDIHFLPLFMARASFRTYLPFIYNSPCILMYATLSLGFRYWCRLFRTIGVINTNFLYWLSLVFIGTYLAELKWRQIVAKMNERPSV